MTQNPGPPSFEPPAQGPDQHPGASSYGQPSSYGQQPSAQPNPTYGQQPTPPRSYPQQSTPPQSYPQQPGPPHQPSPGQFPPPYEAPATPQPSYAEATAGPEPVENVGMGLGMAALGIIAGAVASAAIYRFGFIASIVAFGMSVGMLWLYAKGAGAPPRKGVVPLIGLVVVGLIIAWLFTLASELFFLASGEGASVGEAISFALGNLTNPALFEATAKDALFFFLFGALGMFSTVRQLLAARKAQSA